MLVIRIESGGQRWYYQEVNGQPAFTRGLHYAYRFTSERKAHQTRESTAFLCALAEEFNEAVVEIAHETNPMRKLKLLAVLMLAAASLNAETVFMSAHGKTFHKAQTCMSLSRAKHVYSAERADAEKHGRHACSICYREKKAGASAAGMDWAHEVQKEGQAK